MNRQSGVVRLLKSVFGYLLCIFPALLGLFWAVNLMDSIYGYRSPLKDSPLAPGEAAGEKLTRRLVFVLVDALRLDTSLNPDVMPYLAELRRQGASAVMHSQPPSYSEPGYTTLLTGAWPDLNDGPTFNLDYEDIPAFTQDDLFSAGKRAGLETAISGYYWFEKLVPQDNVDAGFYTPGEDRVADRQVVDAALPWLRSGAYPLLLVHIDQVDYAGHHEGGPGDPNWNAAARRADDLLREIAAELDLSQDTLLVVSDHGQINRGGHGGHEPVVLLEPFVLVGAGIKPGTYADVNMVDVAPTLAILLGASLPASSQGLVLEEMLALPETHRNVLPRLTSTQQNQLVEAYQAAIGRTVEPQLPLAASVRPIVEAYQTALQASRQTRLRDERIPRLILAIPIAVLAGIALFWKRGAALTWQLGGALLAISIFHIRYALLDNLTYSLSWVPSPDALIGYVAQTAIISAGLAFLLVWLGSRTWQKTVDEARSFGLGFTLIALYFLSFPVLWSIVLNGAKTTWTLPDFQSVYLGFISVLQGSVTAVVGVLATGLAVLCSGIIKNIHPGREEVKGHGF